MAEIKKLFSAGKMNQDLSNYVLGLSNSVGQYRSLMNGRIARSEGSDVGALENVRGNFSRSTFIDPAAIVIGSIRDQQRDRIYYFIVGQTEDGIYEYNETQDSIRVILRSTSRSGVLKFSVDHLITGVNLIGEDNERLLYWTDDFNQPRRINIERMVTRHQGRLDGVVDNDTGERIHEPFTEEEIAVVKAPPLNPPTLSSIDESQLREELNANPTDARRREIEEILQEENLREKFVRFAYRWKYVDDEYSTFSPFSDIPFSTGRFTFDRVNGQITSMENQVRAVDISFNTGPRDVVEVELLYVDSTTGVVYVVENFNKANEGWRDNIDLRPRLSTEDTTFVETPIQFSTNKLYRPLPDRELNRVFDDVPRRARAQDISENRIIYGDYVTRYNIEDIRKVFGTDAEGETILENTLREEITVDFDVRLASNRNVAVDSETNTEIIGDNGEKNLKSDRDYEVAIVYGDNVGRRTPPLTSRNNKLRIPLNRANKRNRLEADINSKAPEWATWYRWYVKDIRQTHYNVIPLETIADPFDPEQFAWFRLSEADRNKINVGDHLIIKINNNQFFTESYDEKTTVRVEEIGVQEANFLETTTPRVDPDDDTSEVLTLQRAGTWMKIRNTENFIEDIMDEDNNSFTSESKARSNNTRRFDDYRPIRGSVASYIDNWFYYSAADSPDDSNEEDSLSFGGTYNPAAGNNDQDGTAVIGGVGSGPMRIELEITDPNNTGSGTHFTYNYYINPTPAQGGTGNSKGFYIEVRRITTDIAISTSATTLVNGANVTFDTTEGWHPGDKFTVVYRNGNNFLWRYDERGNNPNIGSKRPIRGRRANVVMPVSDFHAEDESIYGNSIVQFGVEDGLNSGRGGSPLSGRAISMPFEKNVFTTSPNFYPNIEEWMFEEGLWHPGGTSGKRIFGTNRDGDPIGMSHIGFWRGIPVLPRSGADTTVRALTAAGVLTSGGSLAGLAATHIAGAAALGPVGLIAVIGAGVVAGLVNIISRFSRKPGEEDQWRIVSSSDTVSVDVGGEMMTFPENRIYPLYMIVQSGTYNHKRNKNAKDIRMKSAWNYVQGNIGQEQSSNNVQVIFETIPSESALDQQVFYEAVGDTYPCLNGIHFGEDQNNHQLITFLEQDGTETQGFINTANDRFNQLTETSRVSSITVDIDYWNCIAFSNGVESMTIRDEFGTPEITKGVKAANIIDEYEEVRNFSGLIYSGPFVDATGINRLNEFSSFDVGNRSILKDLDENYGPIRKLYSENTDLIVFQDSKVHKVQVDKNALFGGTDGTQVVETSRNFLNQTIPFPGEYGISNNPESFAVYGHTKYWADRNRGIILEMTGDQVTEISDHGMQDYFRDNLSRYPLVLGMYDDYHDQYIVSMQEPFQDPSTIVSTLPVLISKQGFLSRNDACRFPENKLQLQEVYEFYGDTAPLQLQIGDTLYVDQDRTSVFNGDDDWFISFDREEVRVTNVSAVENDQARFEFVSNALRNVVNVGQQITLQSRLTTTSYNAEVTQVGNNTFHARFTGTLPTNEGAINREWDLEVDFKFVVNIDNFGIVRRKLDCVTIPPLNHDAFRISLRGYSSAEEACANGLVGRILYHNGDDATPDVGDYIYDSPYGSDEYVEVYQLWLDNFPYNTGDRVVWNNSTWRALQEVSIGIEPGADGSATYWEATDDPVQYKQGRTQRRGWYQMFDGADFEDYVIRIIEGTVVEKVRCAAIRAGRRQIMIGSHFDVQGANETDAAYATRVCRSIPGNVAWYDGTEEVPQIGDTLYSSDYTSAVYGEGSYAITGGYYVSVNSDGTIWRVVQCVTRVCLTDLINTYGTNNGVFDNQIKSSDQFTFVGLIDEEIFGNTDRQSAAAVTIRWAAKGSQRYPLNPNDFYELVLNDGLAPNQVVTLTNSEFQTASAGDNNLEYTILEFCYNRTLVPQNVVVRYYNDGGEQHVADLATWSNATSTTDAMMTFDNDTNALATWNFLTGDTDTDVPTAVRNGVTREVFTFAFGSHTSLTLATGSAITLQNVSGTPTIVLTTTGFSGTTFAFPNPPQPGDDVNISSGGVPVCTDMGVRYQYPSHDAANVVARIFDITGNQCTGTVEVADEIYFDRTAVTRRRYYIDDTLETSLDGTMGITNTALLDSVEIDGVTRRGLWWAFGDTDNSAATEACLIDEQGFVLECRSREFPFEVTLFHSTTEIGACSAADSTGVTYLADNDDFEDATQFRNLDGSLPAAGFYAWLNDNDTTNPADDQRIVRNWTGTVFNAAIATDNCPVTLPSTQVFYSTNEQTAVCSSGTLTTVYVDNGTVPLVADSDIQLYTNPFGRRSTTNSLLPSGFIQLSDRSTVFTWNAVASSLTVNNVACTQFCTDPDATNTNQAGDCIYPTYCNDSNANNYVASPNAKFTPDNSVCTYDTYTITLNVDTSALLTDGVASTDGFNISNGVLNRTSGRNGESWSFTTQPSIGIASGYTAADGVAAPTFTITNETGTISGSNVTVTVTFTGSVVTESMATTPVGCNTSTAHNYIAGSDGTATCYYSAGSFFDGASDTVACDGLNGGNTSRRTFYTTNSNGSFGNGDTLYGLSDGVYSAAGSGWFTSDGSTVFRLTNGVVSNFGSSCPAYPRFDSLSFGRPSDRSTFNAGEEFAFTLNWSSVGLSSTDTITVAVSGTGVIDTSSTTTGASTSFTDSISIISNPTPGSSFTLRARVSTPDTFRETTIQINIRETTTRGGQSQ